MQPKERLSQHPENHKDTPAFLEAKEDFNQIMELVPEDLRVSRERVAEVIFADEETFERMHYEDSIEMGLPEDEARRDAYESSSVQHATYFEFTQKVAVAAKHDEDGGLDHRKIPKTLYYFAMLTHELGHDQIPRRFNISATAAADIKFIAEETFRELVERQLQRNPNFFLSFLEKIGRDPAEFLSYLQHAMVERGDERTQYQALKAALVQKIDVLLKGMELHVEEYAQYAQAEYDNCCFSSSGRMIGIQWGPDRVLIDRIAYGPESLLSELQADTYMHYMLFVRYVWKKYGQQAQEILSSRKLELLAEYQKTAEFRAFIHLDELSSTYIVEAPIAFRGFERMLRLLIDAQKSTQELSGESPQLSSQEVAAFESIVKAGLAQELVGEFMSEMGGDPALANAIYEGVLKIVRKEQRSNKELVSRIERSFFIGSLAKQLFAEFDPFTVQELILRAAKPIVAKMYKANTKNIQVTTSSSQRITELHEDQFHQAAQGVSRGREHMIVDSTAKEDSHPVLQVMEQNLTKNAVKSLDVLMEKAILVLAHNRKMKYKNK